MRGSECPKCQLMCLDLETLKNHIAKSHCELVASSESEHLDSKNVQKTQELNQIESTKLYKGGKCEESRQNKATDKQKVRVRIQISN